MSKERDVARAGSEKRGLSPFWKRVLIFGGILVGVFLLGLVPMWLEARERADQRDAARGERDAARRELELSRMQNRLATAAIDARRGEYEPARQAASDFYTALRSELENGGDSPLNAPQLEALRPILNGRDELITLLARGDPAAADRLVDLHVTYRNATGSAQQVPGR